MNIKVIMDATGERNEIIEELTGQSLADDVSLIAEDEKSPGELLTELIYEDFVKAR